MWYLKVTLKDEQGKEYHENVDVIASTFGEAVYKYEKFGVPTGYRVVSVNERF